MTHQSARLRVGVVGAGHWHTARHLESLADANVHITAVSDPDPAIDEVEGANDPTDPYPPVTNLLTIADDFESWSALSDKFFAEEDGIVTRIIAESGKAQ